MISNDTIQSRKDETMSLTNSELELWTEIRKAEHEERAKGLRETRGHFAKVQNRVTYDEPKNSPASKAVIKAGESLRECRYPLEDIAAQEFGDDFALAARFTGVDKTIAPADADEEPEDAWINSDHWWTPTKAARQTKSSRDELASAAKAGKFKVKALRNHVLVYQARGVVRWLDNR
jgi:hypothetical protein